MWTHACVRHIPAVCKNAVRKLMWSSLAPLKSVVSSSSHRDSSSFSCVFDRHWLMKTNFLMSQLLYQRVCDQEHFWYQWQWRMSMFWNNLGNDLGSFLTLWISLTSVISQYVYMHAGFPLTFWIWQYSKFDTGHVNSILWLDIPHQAFIRMKLCPIKMYGICGYDSWSTGHVYSLVICASTRVLTAVFVPFYGICSTVKCKQTSKQFAECKKRCMLKRKVHISGQKEKHTNFWALWQTWISAGFWICVNNVDLFKMVVCTAAATGMIAECSSSFVSWTAELEYCLFWDKGKTWNIVSM